MYTRNKDHILVPESLSRQGTPQKLTPESPKKLIRKPTEATPAPKQSNNDESNLQEWDIMISYSHQDSAFMKRLKENLNNSGFSIWVDLQGINTGDNFLSQIGQGIINSKVFLPIISLNQIESRYCRDELSLAYISDKPILPVGLVTFQNVKSQMPTGMRLKLASFDWIPFDNCTGEGGTILLGKEDDFALAFQRLKAAINEAVGQLTEREEDEVSKEEETARKFRETRPMRRLGTQKSFVVEEEDFWEKHFKDKFDVDWIEFIQCFKENYGEKLDNMYNTEDLQWLIKNLHRELKVSSDRRLLRSEYISFIQSSSVYSKNFTSTNAVRVPFFDRVNEYAIETFAVREVFRIESTVRVDAIANLGKFKSQAVIEALLDLLSDEDPNVRAVALISLAKTGNNSNRIIKIICDSLEDTDRLVRESACLALGRLRYSDHEDLVVSKILELWRNDYISSVRESAALALQQLDSEPARLAIKMTEILQREIKLLKD